MTEAASLRAGFLGSENRFRRGPGEGEGSGRRRPDRLLSLLAVIGLALLGLPISTARAAPRPPEDDLDRAVEEYLGREGSMAEIGLDLTPLLLSTVNTDGLAPRRRPPVPVIVPGLERERPLPEEEPRIWPPVRPAEPEADRREGSGFPRPWIRYSRLAPSGSMRITRGGHEGSATEFRWDGDLGLGAEGVPEVGVRVDLGDHRFGISGLSADFQAATRTGSAFVFHGRTYPAGTSLDSRLQFLLLTAAWDVEVMRSDIFTIRGGARGYLYDLRATLDGRTPGGERRSESRGLRSGRPAAFLGLEARRGDWRLDLEVAGGVLAGGRSLLDSSLTLGYRHLDWLAVEAGYRIFHLGLSETTNEGELDLAGFFVEMALFF